MRSIDNTNYRYGRSTLSLASAGVKKKCSKLKLEQLGYSCEELESQKIDIDTLLN